MRRPPLRALLLLSLLAAGCGRSSSAPVGAEPAQAPAPSSADADEKAEEPATLEEAEALLSRAQAELDSALGGTVAFATPPAAEQASGAAAPAPPPEPKAAPRAEERGASPVSPERQESEASRAEGASKKEASDCALACRAFQSLNRAVDAVCRLDAVGERCSRARRVAADAQARVASCSCQAP